MRTNYEFTLSEGFLLNKRNGKLEEYKPISITFDTKREIVVYRGLFWSGERIITESEFELYASASDYEQGKKVSMRTYSLRDIFSPFCCVDIVSDKVLAWKFVDGQAVHADILGHSVTFDVRNGWIGSGTAHLCEKVRLYNSREEAISMNDTVIVGKDGNEKVRIGFSTLLKLNEKQLDAMKKFEEAWKALNELDVNIVVNSDTYEIFCCNKVKNADLEWCDTEGYVRVDREFTPLKANLYHTFHSDGLWMRHED